MASKYYAVKVGVTPGVYNTWDECKAMTHGYPGTIYKSFPTYEEALAFVGTSKDASTDKNKTNIENTVENDRSYAFVDGSYNVATKVYGYGGFLIHNGEKHVITGSGKEEELASMRNVAGEILGSMEAVKLAISLGITELDIYYDYMGIEMWATGSWKRNLKGTIEYYEFMQSIKNKIRLNFIKVKGHSGVDGNDEADKLAKTAVGLNAI